jgi:flagellar protein FlaG
MFSMLFLIRTDPMASEISNNYASGAGAALSRLPTPAPSISVANGTVKNAEKAKAIALPEKPVLIAPKHVDIKFDEIAERQNLKDAVSMLNDQMASTKRGLGFSYNEAVNSAVVTVHNTETGEVVRQIPSEVVIRVAQGIESFKGMLHNKKV